MIPKKYLLLLAGLVWGAAGFNILRLGLLAYVGLVKPLYLLLSAAVFVIFQKMVFGKLVQKHTARILAYEAPKVWFWHFFDRKSFLIMAFICGNFHWCPLILLPFSTQAWGHPCCWLEFCSCGSFS